MEKLSAIIKESTRAHHQETEKKVVLRIKNIRNNEDYAALLKCFYAYFGAVEKAIAPYINDILPDYAERRDSSFIRKDIEALGGSTENLPRAIAPAIANGVQAMGALYVLEGSIMGGPYIVQMLQKKGIDKGFDFFGGYGEGSAGKWAAFTEVLDNLPGSSEEQDMAVRTASETFKRFGDVFDEVAVTGI
ncbi:heme oxygenase [Sinomicrobium oceani]|uniref:Heme oxygenase n=1 Tax=Sinomicrobium oceani TaxID=1150368 RepID=A0A1K1M7B4_9FLAO|nr:biliverdin-producing heme oxygenase [Sinomicrobium oceani]SFW19032.1 heme oxygenase [Sinomicrobium oceani]